MIGLGTGHTLTLADSRPLVIPFSPLGIASMGEWFDYRVLLAVGYGNPVSSWPGRKGLYTATASGSARGTFELDTDGRAYVAMDGVDDSFQFAMTYGDLLGPDGNYEAWFVVKSPASVSISNELLNCGSGGVQSVALQVQPAYTRFNWYSTSNSNFGAPLDTQDGKWHVIRFAMKPTGPTSYVDGVEIGFGSSIFGFPGTWNTGAATGFIGAGSFGATGFWNGGFRHVWTSKAPLDDGTAAALTSYLMMA